MTPTDLINAVLAADEAATSKYGPQKKYPFYFVEHPEVNELIDAAPRLARSLRIALEALKYAESKGSCCAKDCKCVQHTAFYALAEIEKELSGDK